MSAPAAGLNTLLPFCSDPDNVAFCVLAADEEDEGDIALQIHFTLIQAFCCENDIDIVRVNDLAKLAAIVGPSEDSGEPRDFHCILIMVSVSGSRAGCCPPMLCLRCGIPCGVVRAAGNGSILWAGKGRGLGAPYRKSAE